MWTHEQYNNPSKGYKRALDCAVTTRNEQLSVGDIHFADHTLLSNKNRYFTSYFTLFCL